MSTSISWGLGRVDKAPDSAGVVSASGWPVEGEGGPPPGGGVSHGGQLGLYRETGKGTPRGQGGMGVVWTGVGAKGALVTAGGGLGAKGVETGESTCIGWAPSAGGAAG